LRQDVVVDVALALACADDIQDHTRAITHSAPAPRR